MEAILIGAGVALGLSGAILFLAWFLTKAVPHVPLAKPPRPPLMEGRGEKPGTKRPLHHDLSRSYTHTRPPPDGEPPTSRPGAPTLTANDALLAIVEATANVYHPDMTIQDVARFVGRVTDSLRGRLPRGSAIAYVHGDPATGREVFRLEVGSERG